MAKRSTFSACNVVLRALAALPAWPRSLPALRPSGKTERKDATTDPGTRHRAPPLPRTLDLGRVSSYASRYRVVTVGIIRGEMETARPRATRYRPLGARPSRLRLRQRTWAMAVGTGQCSCSHSPFRLGTANPPCQCVCGLVFTYSVSVLCMYLPSLLALPRPMPAGHVRVSLAEQTALPLLSPLHNLGRFPLNERELDKHGPPLSLACPERWVNRRSPQHAPSPYPSLFTATLSVFHPAPAPATPMPRASASVGPAGSTTLPRSNNGQRWPARAFLFLFLFPRHFTVRGSFHWAGRPALREEPGSLGWTERRRCGIHHM